MHLLGGLLGLLLKSQRAQVTVYNDHDSAITTLFAVVRLDPAALARALARPEHGGEHRDAATTYQRLHAAWYGRALAQDTVTTRRVLAQLRPVHARLGGVLFEHLPWEALLRRYDDPRTAFAVDAARLTPPVQAALLRARGRWALHGPDPSG